MKPFSSGDIWRQMRALLRKLSERNENVFMFNLLHFKRNVSRIPCKRKDQYGGLSINGIEVATSNGKYVDILGCSKSKFLFSESLLNSGIISKIIGTPYVLENKIYYISF